MLKILQARLQLDVHQELPDVQAGKAEEPDIKSPTFFGSQKKQRNSRKTSTSDSLTTLKPLTMCITTNCDSLKGKRLFNDGTGTMRYLCGNKVKIDSYLRSHNETVTGRSQT